MPLADIETSLALLIPITALMIPIVAILTAHQRKMAQLIHGSQQNMPHGETEALRREMQELKEVVHQQTIAIDSISRRQLPSETGDRYTGV